MSQIDDPKQLTTATTEDIFTMGLSDFLLPETDINALSTNVQQIASHVYQEFEMILETHGPAVVEQLMPILVGVLEKLDELFKDQTAYRTEVGQLREDKASLMAELERERIARKDSEHRLMSVEDQFEDERKAINEALIENTTIIRQLEMKNRNSEEQICRLDKRENDLIKENTRLHERIGELIRSNLELTDSLKGSITIPIGNNAQKSAQSRPSANVFDTTSGGLGFDELSAMEGDLSPQDEDFEDEFSFAAHGSDTEQTEFDESSHGPLSGMQKEVNILIRENMELIETKNALNVVKDDLLTQRDLMKLENQLLMESVRQLTMKHNDLQIELSTSDQQLSAARTALEEFKADINKRQHRSEDVKSPSKRFTKTEMASLVSDRNFYKERLMELQEAVRLTEALRASQRGHPELLKDFPTVTDVHRVEYDPETSTSSAISEPQTNPSPLSALTRLPPISRSIESSPAAVSTASQAWIKISQTSTATPVFGWVRGFGRVKSICDGGGGQSLFSRPLSSCSFSPQAYPVPKRCRSIGGPSSLRIELSTGLSVPSPVEDDYTQHLWLVGKGPISQLDASKSPLKTTEKICGKIYLFDPMELTKPLASLDLDDEFIPLCAGLFTVSDPRKISTTPEDRLVILKDFKTLKPATSQCIKAKVLIASSDGRFLVCMSAKHPDRLKAFEIITLTSFRLSKPGESAAALVSMEYHICLGVLNSSGSNQLVTLKWHLDTSTATISDVEFNQVLHTNTLSLPGNTGSPSGPIIMSAIYESAYFWLGTVGGGALHLFDLSVNRFICELQLPSETPCLHAVVVGTPLSDLKDSRIIWLAVSGSLSADFPILGPHSRLLSICSKKRVFLRNIDLTSVLTSMIDISGVVDPVDLTVCRLFVQGDECIWFATRCGLIGRFFHSFISKDEKVNVPSEVCFQDAISISCHAYKRPVSALVAVGLHVEPGADLLTPVSDGCDRQRETATATVQSLFVVAIGHDYVYLRTSTPTTVLRPDLSVGSNHRLSRSTPGAHAIVWSVSQSE